MQDTKPQEEGKLEIDRYERIYIILAAAMLGVFFAALIAGAIIYGVRLPTASAFINPILIDETEFANPGLRDMGDGNYEVYIVAHMWAYEVGTTEKTAVGLPILRVPEGAKVTFNITSRDVQHGFYIEHHNVNLQILPGHIASQTVTFSERGTYHVICHEYCGRGHQTMGMVIIVEPADGA
ncbi:MAG: cytochrome c oxidase subunit II [Anaerolineae bacterium]|nr:cytochrome c oxidase subunit II [Anaerolineae bacterium]